MNGIQRLAGGISCMALLGCTAGGQQPATLDPKNDACAQCRMVVSDQRFASQVVAPGQEPRFFDDLGCLRTFLKAGAVPQGAIAFVADHRTKEWVEAATAIYVRNPQVMTPMGSHLLAYADEASREADPAGKGTRVPSAELFGPDGPPAGRKP